MKKSNLNILSVAAQKLKLKTELIINTPAQKTLLVSNQKKFYLASGKAPGFYPEAKRFNSHLSNNKFLTQTLLKRLGYKVIVSTKISIAQYKSFADFWKNLQHEQYKFPALIKPNSGMWGRGITIAENANELKKILQRHFREKVDCMVQPILDENEYRVLVINGEVLLMHSKHNPHIVGDGQSTIKELLSKVADWRKNDTYINWQHKKQKTTTQTVLPTGSKFDYHLTKIPTAEYYETFATKKIPAATKKWALKLAKDTNSSVVGIDVFIPGPFGKTKDYVVIELNTNPGLDYLITHCKDTVTPYQIFEKVLRDYFFK